MGVTPRPEPEPAPPASGVLLSALVDAAAGEAVLTGGVPSRDGEPPPELARAAARAETPGPTASELPAGLPPASGVRAPPAGDHRPDPRRPLCAATAAADGSGDEPRGGTCEARRAVVSERGTDVPSDRPRKEAGDDDSSSWAAAIRGDELEAGEFRPLVDMMGREGEERIEMAARRRHRSKRDGRSDSGGPRWSQGESSVSPSVLFSPPLPLFYRS